MLFRSDDSDPGVVDDTSVDDSGDDPVDADGDGFLDDIDCNDDDDNVYPGAPGLCDGQQNDCEVDWVGDAGLATWMDEPPVDMSAELAAGGTFTMGDGTLRLCEGTWLLEIHVSGDLTIEGAEADAVLSGEGSWTPLQIVEQGASLTVSELTVEGGLASLLVPDGSELGGGALYCHGASVTLDEVVFADNISAGMGGAAFAQDCEIQISGGRVQQNEAVDGGGMFLVGGSLEMVDAWFESNIATETGGALVAYDGVTGVLDDSHFSLNTAEIGGGVALFEDNVLDFVNAYFASNAADYGAAVAMGSGEVVTFDGGKVKKNEATEAGGAVYSGGGNTLTATGTEISENSAITGGALYMDADTVTLYDVVMDENKADKGGAAYLEGTEATLEASLVRTNIAVEGGAFYVKKLVSLEIVSTDFSANDPDDLQYSGGDSYSFGLAAETSCDNSGCD